MNACVSDVIEKPLGLQGAHPAKMLSENPLPSVDLILPALFWGVGFSTSPVTLPP